MPPTPRPEIAGIEPVAHGAITPSELAARALELGAGCREPSRCGAIDFSVNTNPLGPSPRAVAALATLGTSEIGRYPDPAASALRRALAARYGVTVEEILVGNGSSEIIWLLALAYAHPHPERVLIAGPTFGEYERACRLVGASIIHFDSQATDHFLPDVRALVTRIRAEKPRIVWLCNPNNPTGVYLPAAEVVPAVEACVAAGALLVVDEAYLAFVQRPDSLVPLLRSQHLFLLRSLTKDYALAGLRLGCGVGTREVIETLRKTQPPWSVGAAAQAAGVAALEDEGHLAAARAAVREARAMLLDGLERLELRAAATPAANYVLVEVGNAAAFRTRLLTRGVVVRDCTSFGLPAHVRIAVRTRSECAALLAAIEATRSTANLVDERASALQAALRRAATAGRGR